MVVEERWGGGGSGWVGVKDGYLSERERERERDRDRDRDRDRQTDRQTDRDNSET